MARVIILNGVSSAGKTTIAKAIQQLADRDFLHVSMDVFIAMLPDGREFNAEWFPVETVASDHGPLTRIGNGPMGERLLLQMRAFVAELADSGFDVIVDEVCRSRGIDAYRTLLDGHRLQIVQVTGDLRKIEQRERERGDRLVGLARAQAMNLHDDIAYDHDMDTTAASPEECAKYILDALA
ncbi:AAA family ATPase [Citromicrobium bathyomarinum]